MVLLVGGLIGRGGRVGLGDGGRGDAKGQQADGRQDCLDGHERPLPICTILALDRLACCRDESNRCPFEGANNHLRCAAARQNVAPL